MNRVTVGLILLLIPLIAICVDSEPDYFQLLHADKLRNITYGENPIRELIDSVEVSYGNMFISCDNARHDAARGILECKGRVVVTHYNRILHANEMTYYEGDRRLEAYGNVQMQEDSLYGECVRAIYYRDLDHLQMRREAMLEDKEQQVLLTAHRIDYDHLTGIAWSHSEPLLRARHEEQGNVKVLADYMEMRRFEHLQLAAGDVHINLQQTEATCDTFFYCDTTRRGSMKGAPQLLHDNREISGELMNLVIAGEMLREVEVFGDGRAEVPADSIDEKLINSFSGDTLRFYFDEGDLRRMEAVGEANSVYYSADEQGRPGLNLTAGDMIILELDSTAISRIEVEGGSRGRYLPLRRELTLNREHDDGEPESD
jgi:lipopolysaccharide export system protein LptA